MGDSTHLSPLLVIPISGEVLDPHSDLEFHNLSTVLNSALNDRAELEACSRNMIIRLEEWLSERQLRDAGFTRRMFESSAVGSRIQRCVLNPAYYGPQRLLFYSGN